MSALSKLARNKLEQEKAELENDLRREIEQERNKATNLGLLMGGILGSLVSLAVASFLGIETTGTILVVGIFVFATIYMIYLG